MSLCGKAKKEISVSLPYFQLLVKKNLSSQLRKLFVKEAPNEFFNTLTQIARHYLNGTFCIENNLLVELENCGVRKSRFYYRTVSSFRKVFE